MGTRFKLDMDTAVSAGVLAFTLLNYFYFIPVQVVEEGSPATYPIIVNTLMCICGAGYFLQSVFGAPAAEDVESPPKPRNLLPLLRVAAVAVLLAVWIWVMESVGFLLSSMVFLAAGIALFGSRQPFKIGAVSIGLPILLYVLFRILLKSVLPEGPLEGVLEQLIFG